MQALVSLAVVASAVWVAIDSSKLGFEKRDLRGIAAMSPVGWTLCMLFLWIVAFPMYLVKRDYLKAMGAWRRQVGPGYPPATSFLIAPPPGQPPPPGYAPPPGAPPPGAPPGPPPG